MMAGSVRLSGQALGVEYSPLTPEELNAAYARLEERYNCWKSNWEWFIKAEYVSDGVSSIQARVEQN
ncbi:MAG: hypothetical protein ACPL5F_07125 [Moorellaceae bacterium]